MVKIPPFLNLSSVQKGGAFRFVMSKSSIWDDKLLHSHMEGQNGGLSIAMVNFKSMFGWKGRYGWVGVGISTRIMLKECKHNVQLFGVTTRVEFITCWQEMFTSGSKLDGLVKGRLIMMCS